jgi:hypothetical protein
LEGRSVGWRLRSGGEIEGWRFEEEKEWVKVGEW